MNQKQKKIYWLYFGIFYVVWAVITLIVRPAVNAVIPENSVKSIIIFDWLIKNLCWTVPALKLIIQFENRLYLKKQELFHFSVEREFFLVVFGEILFCVFNSVIAHKGFYVNWGNWVSCLAFVFVGITEEFVFRGFLLNATITDKNQNFAIGLNAILFLSIHFPIWILQGNFVQNFSHFGFVTIILLSIFFSWSMLKFRNIWSSVILHMLWDILVTMLN